MWMRASIALVAAAAAAIRHSTPAGKPVAPR